LRSRAADPGLRNMATDPVCGMTVEEATADLRLVRDNRTYYFCSRSCLETFAEPRRELRSLKARLAVGAVLSVGVLALTYGPRVPEGAETAALLAGVVQFYPGWHFYRGLADAVRSRHWNMDVLVAVGSSVAYGYSVVALLGIGGLPRDLYFDASSLIITLILAGNYIERGVRDRAAGTLLRLRERLPARALRIRNGVEEEVPLEEIRPGDRLRVLPGGSIPCDGLVIRGESSVEEALLTGEPGPVRKAPGDRVLAGTINGPGPLEIEAQAVAEDTFLAEIGRLVQDAETDRMPLSQLADRIAERFVPGVLALAVASSLAWHFLGSADLAVTLLVFVTVAITACPCAFGLATPAALMVGTTGAAEDGILFKGRGALERLDRVDVVLTDKTGTLTAGTPRLVEVHPLSEERSHLLAIAAGLESGSEHPLAQAVLQAAHDEGIAPAPVEAVKVLPGLGISGFWEGKEVFLGTADPADLAAEGLEDLWRGAQERGQTVSVVKVGSRVAGALFFEDSLLPESEEGVRWLRSLGIRVILVSGDQEGPVRRVAERLGLAEALWGQTPSQKLERIRQWRNEGYTVAFVGDGINDAPALTAADVGIAIGGGTDVAREAGHVVLLRRDFRDVARALLWARATVRKVRQNLWWALGYNGVLLPIAAGVLVPLFTLAMYNVLPMLGALAMGLSSTSVLVNSLSLRRSLRVAPTPGETSLKRERSPPRGGGPSVP
jgi:Cu+-exporting ATPase